MPRFVKQQVGMVQNKDKARLGKDYKQEEKHRADQKADQFGLGQNVPFGPVHAVVLSWIAATDNSPSGVGADYFFAFFFAAQ